MDPSALLAFIPVKYVGIATSVIALCAAFTAAVKPPKNRRTAWGFLYQGIDWVALNFAHGTTAHDAVAKGVLVPASSVPVVVVPPVQPPSTASATRNERLMPSGSPKL